MQVIKRDGRKVDFDIKKIQNAIRKASIATGEFVDHFNVAQFVEHRIHQGQLESPTVEQIQDIVEKSLIASGHFDTARAYILYREEHAKNRIPQNVKDAFRDSTHYFPTPLQMFQFYDKYARWGNDRRETWRESVDRCVEYLEWLSGYKLDIDDYDLIHSYMMGMKAMPSMRLLAMAGKAAKKNPISIMNCAYLTIDSLTSFSEALYIAMAGCGIGYSVENQYVDKLQGIQVQKESNPYEFEIEDSSEGWYHALLFGLDSWFDGHDVKFDFSQIRPSGALLKTKGGRASGPEPFRKALLKIREKILSRQGKKLRPIDAHDIMCYIASAVICGGVRRTALLALFDWDDSEMLHCKDGDLSRNTQRWNANNSAVLPENISQTEFIRFFLEMVESERGEPGIFSRQASIKHRPARREKAEFGPNACAEVTLRPFQFCNLSMVVARENDTLETLKGKVKVATIIGTIQSMATDFPLLRSVWKENQEDERLLGVDIIGHMDCPTVRNPLHLESLRKESERVNHEYAKKLGIKPSMALTCAKPSGNSSVLLDSAPGIHSRWSDWYIRNVRVNANSPIYKVLRDNNVPLSPENGQTVNNATMWVASFPTKSPSGAITRKDRTAIQQCEYWLRVKSDWAEHSVSCTVTYNPDEIIDLMVWLWEYRDYLTGLTFLPNFDAAYDLMPYVEISQDEYERLNAEFPEIDFSLLWRYEKEDYTTAAQELACGSGGCEI